MKNDLKCLKFILLTYLIIQNNKLFPALHKYAISKVNSQVVFLLDFNIHPNMKFSRNPLLIIQVTVSSNMYTLGFFY